MFESSSSVCLCPDAMRPLVCILLAILVVLFHEVHGAWDLSQVLGGNEGQKAIDEAAAAAESSTAANSAISLSASSLPSFTKAGDKCPTGGDASDALVAIACSVESGEWSISKESIAFKNAGCLIGTHWDGRDRCDAPIAPPKETAVPKSPPPRDSLSKDYKRLAEKAEELVPKTWWRDGFANDVLLLSHNDKEGPLRFFNVNTKLRNKKLRNINQCVTRQNFIRKAYSFRDIVTPSASTGSDAQFEQQQQQGRRKLKGKRGECDAMAEPVVQTFWKLWQADKGMFGGGWKERGNAVAKGEEGANTGAPTLDTMRRNPNDWEWVPRMHHTDGEAVYVAAMEVLEYFFMSYGGIWTGCFRLEINSDCRGALAAAAITSATHILHDIGARRRDKDDDVGRLLVEGYLLASLGRALLHGDMDSTGDQTSTIFKLRLADFTLLQQSFLKLYVDSFGTLYSDQLDTAIPVSFRPEFAVTTKPRWKSLLGSHNSPSAKKAATFEPFYSHVRNWMYTEANNLIDFGPYRPLAAIPDAQRSILGGAGGSGSGSGGGRRILIDVGANGFFASPKYLIDSYAPYAPFDDVIMIEPEPHFKAGIPDSYSKRYNMTNLKIYAEVNTQSSTDIIQLLPTLVRPNDFVVLKFDVDPNKYAYGATMEWGFLFDLMRTPENKHIAGLVDELYVELHFHQPKLFWEHYHSNWEALDMFRSLRQQGMAVHAWP